MDAYVEDHLAWRLLEESDAAEVEALRAQLNQFDDPVLASVERLVEQSGPITATGDEVGGWDAYGNLMAFGKNIIQVSDSVRIHLAGGVHPAHRYKGIGRALLSWQVARATAWRDELYPERSLWIGCYADHRLTPLREVLSTMGFRDEGYFYDLHRDLSQAPSPRTVEGIGLVEFSQDWSEPVRLLHNRCFADPGGNRAVGVEAWEDLLSGAAFRPTWSFVALEDRVPVGYALSRLDDLGTPEGTPWGWTDRVGVDQGHRGRGISLALLSRSLGAMAADGCGGAGIGVDTLDPASPEVLCRELGYEARDGLVLLGRQFPPVR